MTMEQRRSFTTQRHKDVTKNFDRFQSDKKNSLSLSVSHTHSHTTIYNYTSIYNKTKYTSLSIKYISLLIIILLY